RHDRQDEPGRDVVLPAEREQEPGVQPKLLLPGPRDLGRLLRKRRQHLCERLLARLLHRQPELGTTSVASRGPAGLSAPDLTPTALNRIRAARRTEGSERQQRRDPRPLYRRRKAHD